MAGVSEEEVARMILKITAGGYDPDIGGGGSCDNTITNKPSIDEEDDKVNGAMFAAPAPVNVIKTCKTVSVINFNSHS